MKRLAITAIALLLVNSFITAQQNRQDSKEYDAVKATALNYGDGWYSGSSERMESALHPELNKVSVIKFGAEGKPVLQYSTVSGLVEMAGGKRGMLDEDKRKESVDVYDIDGNIACAKLNSAQFNDYLVLVKFSNGWKIVNVLWNPGPDAQQKPVVADFNPGSEKDAIINAAKDFTEGILNCDIARFGKSSHSELNLVQVAGLPSSERNFLTKIGPGMLMELLNAKMIRVPENMRSSESKILDSSDGYAFVKSVSPSITFYLQMAKIGGNWITVNALLNPGQSRGK